MGIENPIGNSGDFNVYDVRAPANDPNPPNTYQDYLADPEIQKKIGAKSEYQDCASGANRRFSSTGDRMFLSVLTVVQEADPARFQILPR